MTTTDVLRTLGRRWYVVLAGLLLTGLVAYPVLNRPPVYFTDVHVQLIPPEGPGQGLSDRGEGLIALAGLVERSLDAGNDVEVPVSPQVSIVDMGIREGVIVVLPNSGGQWSTNFTQPVLHVQAAGSTPEAAVALREHSVNEVEATLRRVQLEHGVGVRYMVSPRLVPDTPRVVAASGPQTQAAAVVVVLGLLFTMLIGVHVDHLLTRLRRRRRGRLTLGSATTA